MATGAFSKVVTFDSSLELKKKKNGHYHTNKLCDF